MPLALEALAKGQESIEQDTECIMRNKGKAYQGFFSEISFHYENRRKS